LEQVFVNLITNAVQALASISAPRKLTIKSREANDSILLTFADNGPGISDDIINRIFDPFFSTKQIGEGTGLGLSICYGIISEHKGRIWTENSSSDGAVFYISLPIVAPAKPVIKSDLEPAKVAMAIPNNSPLKILAVDDEPPLLNLLNRVLEKQGHQVDTAPNGGIAQQKINTQGYDLIICDVLMPDMLGPDLYKQAIEDWPDLVNRFIFITGNVVDADTRTFLEKSGLPWLPKPFLPTDRERAIVQAVSKLKTPV
jgi:two-component system NtrC family sensor kinase